MNLHLKKLVYLCAVLVTTQLFVEAASISIDAPAQTSTRRQPFIVQIYVDSDKDTISGFSGDFSFDSDLFLVSNISIDNTVVPLWIKQPTVSKEIYLDGRTHVTFEGIFPGGYSGVRSPYYQGLRQGRMFSVVLIPKNKGKGTFVVDNIILNSFDSEATPLKTTSSIKSITVPDQVGDLTIPIRVPVEIQDNSLTAFITRDQLVNNNAWYLVINEDESKSAIESIYVAETDDRVADAVSQSMWRKAANQYILRYQNRTKYIHIKVIYSDNTYALTTLPPVENSHRIPVASRILIGVAIALLVLYFYGKLFFTPYIKQP